MRGRPEEQRFLVLRVLRRGAQQALGFVGVVGRRVGAHGHHRTAVRGLVSCRCRPYGARVHGRGRGRGRGWRPGRGRLRGRLPDRLRGRAVLRRGLWIGGETAVSVGLVLLLFVVHQLWWTNQQARAGAREQVLLLERAWAGEGGGEGDRGGGGGGEGGRGGEGGGGGSAVSPAPAVPSVPSVSSPAVPSFAPSVAYAVLRVPAIGLVVPVAPGVERRGVLDRGFVGHYPRTASAGDVGNFALAGHRNSHGEPFRHLDRLGKGDRLLVETRDRTHVYVVDLVLPETSPRDVGVIAPVPRSLVRPAYGYEAPGRYLTLTTCTPAFRSTHRLVVWGVLAETRVR
ncbi:class E sortase [Streptomyces sp. NPDC047928]|uniref:class E sortase n=1 Tax=unclassified Streptomyces TaxID=2593676 RepID=UPI00370FC2A2